MKFRSKKNQISEKKNIPHGVFKQKLRSFHGNWLTIDQIQMYIWIPSYWRKTTWVLKQKFRNILFAKRLSKVSWREKLEMKMNSSQEWNKSFFFSGGGGGGEGGRVERRYPSYIPFLAVLSLFLSISSLFKYERTHPLSPGLCPDHICSESRSPVFCITDRFLQIQGWETTN